jgi:hypothetical protein
LGVVGGRGNRGDSGQASGCRRESKSGRGWRHRSWSSRLLSPPQVVGLARLNSKDTTTSNDACIEQCALRVLRSPESPVEPARCCCCRADRPRNLPGGAMPNDPIRVGAWRTSSPPAASTPLHSGTEWRSISPKHMGPRRGPSSTRPVVHGSPNPQLPCCFHARSSFPGTYSRVRFPLGRVVGPRPRTVDGSRGLPEEPLARGPARGLPEERRASPHVTAPMRPLRITRLLRSASDPRPSRVRRPAVARGPE